MTKFNNGDYNSQIHYCFIWSVNEDFDIILLTIKSFDTIEASKLVSKFIKEKTLFVSLQNGINNYEKIVKVIPSEKVIMGRVIFGVEVKDPGKVYISVYAEEVQAGQPDNKIHYEIIENIAKCFDQAGIPTLATKEIMKVIWAKLLYNSALNPLSALLGVSYGALPHLPGIPDIMKSIVTEAFCVAKAHKQALFWENPEDYLQLLYERLIPSTAAHYASMHYDLIHGKRTETDAMNGAISKLGKRLNIQTPCNSILSSIIKSKECISKNINASMP